MYDKWNNESKSIWYNSSVPLIVLWVILSLPKLKKRDFFYDIEQ